VHLCHISIFIIFSDVLLSIFLITIYILETKSGTSGFLGGKIQFTNRWIKFFSEAASTQHRNMSKPKRR
jgi:hypothetical protein